MKIKMKHIMNEVGFHLLPLPSSFVCQIENITMPSKSCPSSNSNDIFWRFLFWYNSMIVGPMPGAVPQQLTCEAFPQLLSSHLVWWRDAICLINPTHNSEVPPQSAHNTRLVSCGAKSWLEKWQMSESCLHLWWFGLSCRVHLWCRKEQARG